MIEPACHCGHSYEEHGGDPDHPGWTGCTSCGQDECIAYEVRWYAALAGPTRTADQPEGVRSDSDRLDWLERHLFDSHWDGTIGRPKEWRMAGPYRHTLVKMRGNTLREAIDRATSPTTAEGTEK